MFDSLCNRKTGSACGVAGVMLLGLVLSAASSASAAVILVDFQDVGRNPTQGGTWNKLVGANSDLSAGNVVYTDNTVATGVSIATDGFAGDTGNGLDWAHAGTTFVDAQAGDGVWFLNAAGTASITLAGLPTGLYNISLLAARDISSAQFADYSIVGVGASDEGNPFDAGLGAWSNGTVLDWLNVSPNFSSEIVLNMQRNPNNVYITALRVESLPVPEPVGLMTFALGAVAFTCQRKFGQRQRLTTK